MLVNFLIPVGLDVSVCQVLLMSYDKGLLGCAGCDMCCVLV